MIKGKKILITGGSGFIGNILANQLTSFNDVTIIDKRPQQIKTDAVFYQKDITNLNNVSFLFKDIDIVFHLASDISIKYCIENPNESLYNNTLLNNNVLECCRINNVEKIIFSSTAAVYKQKNSNVSYCETDDLCPLNPYSASKAYGENLCKIYWDLYGVKTVSLRYFNVYGNSNLTSSYSSVLNNFLYNFRHHKTLTINGDGTQTRDFIHVDDVVQANLLAASTPLETYGEVFNIGSGKTISIYKIAQAISSNIEYGPQPVGELLYSQANIQKAANLLKWFPRQNILDWIKKEILH
jgi:UDP-glucose 4-epimerase